MSTIQLGENEHDDHEYGTESGNESAEDDDSDDD